MSQDPTPGVCAITGAGGGIGRALAVHAAQRGYAVALCDLTEDGLEETAAEVAAAGGRARTMVADVRDRAALDAFAAMAEAIGRVTLLFANAGILRRSPILGQPAEDWALMVDVNLRGLVHTIQAFAGPMTGRATPSRIVVGGSQAGFVTYPSLGLYSATKHAAWALAEGLRDQLAQASPQVAVSLVCPGAVATPMTGFVEGHMPAAELARRVFEGLDAGRFLILSHPAFVDAMEARFAATLADARRNAI